MKQKLNFILLSLLLISIVVIIISISLRYLSGGNVPLDYGITIDAGSSKIKFVLYDWLSVKNQTGFVKELSTQKLKISIDEYANNLTALERPLLTSLKSISQKIPNTRNDFSIPIYLGSTAGMRLLKAYNNQDSDKILKKIRSIFEQYTESEKRFKVENVEIISGDKEGLYCWISTNYLMKYIPPENKQMIKGTVGILDMGGASAQIAFQIDKTQKTSLIANENCKLFGQDYDVYSDSNLCFGNDDARHRYQYVVINKSDSIKNRSNVVLDPCTHPGQLNRTITRSEILDDVCTRNKNTELELIYSTYIFKASPDLKKCHEYTKLLVDENFVKEKFPSNGEEINFKIMPERPPIDTTFYALATYFYSTQRLRKKDENISFADEDELRKEIDQYCNRTWEDVIKDGNNNIEYLHNFCFSLNYMFFNLKFVYKFEGQQFNQIEFREKLNGQDLGWTLGYMLQATNSIPEGEPDKPILTDTAFIVLFVFGLVLFLGIFLIFLKIKICGKKRDYGGQI